MLARRHLNKFILTNFENLNSLSNIFQETLNFLVLTDPQLFYLFKNYWQTFSLSHLKVTKILFGPKVKYLSETFFADLCCLEGISCFDLDCVKARLRDSTLSSYKEASKYMKKNLLKAEFDALKSLIRNKELIIQKANKGNIEVLLNRKG